MDHKVGESLFLDDDFKTGSAVPLVCFDHEAGNKLVLSREAESMIRNLPSPIGVISAVGNVKTGKSFLLNRVILDIEGGFAVGSSVDPCTKGLWIWNRPLRRLLPSGKIMNLLVVDTQGVGSSESNMEQDLTLFALSALLSSYLIYNSFGHIDEASIANLSLVAELAKLIESRATSDDERSYVAAMDRTPFFMFVPPLFTIRAFQHCSACFHVFHDIVSSLILCIVAGGIGCRWVLRDFALQLVDDEEVTRPFNAPRNSHSV
jgi:hypothetical protein